jgi:hypothetical protein
MMTKELLAIRLFCRKYCAIEGNTLPSGFADVCRNSDCALRPFKNGVDPNKNQERPLKRKDGYR